MTNLQLSLTFMAAENSSFSASRRSVSESWRYYESFFIHVSYIRDSFLKDQPQIVLFTIYFVKEERSLEIGVMY